MQLKRIGNSFFKIIQSNNKKSNKMKNLIKILKKYPKKIAFQRILWSYQKRINSKIFTKIMNKIILKQKLKNFYEFSFKLNIKKTKLKIGLLKFLMKKNLKNKEFFFNNLKKFVFIFKISKEMKIKGGIRLLDNLVYIY